MNEKIDAKKAREWLIKAEKHFKYDSNIIDLKEKLYDLIETNANENEINDWEQFLLKAIVTIQIIFVNNFYFNNIISYNY